nr:type 1 glutamine amidotransferase [Streptomyces spiramenti]
MPVLVVQHGPQGGPRRVGTWLTEAGLELRVAHGYSGDAVPERPGDHAAVVVLGGGYLPDDDRRAPWLAPTRRLVRAALDTGVPVLGICLGGQLLAHVAGGTVEGAAGEPEFGSTPLTLRPEADDDPLFRGLPDEVTAIERHVDRISVLPPGAHWLVESRACPHQAFRVGDSAWGTQFHPEVAADRLAEWDPEPLRRRGLDPAELVRRAAEAEPAAEAVWRTVTRRFARVVAETAEVGSGR